MLRTFPAFVLGFAVGAALTFVIWPALAPKTYKVEVAAISSTYDSPAPAAGPVTDAASGVYVRPAAQ